MGLQTTSGLDKSNATLARAAIGVLIATSNEVLLLTAEACMCSPLRNAAAPRGRLSVLQAKEALEGTNATGLSAADVIVAVASQAVLFCGGPNIPILVGRSDADGPDPEGRLPLETYDIGQLKQCFASAGLSVQEMVCLSGAHTLGAKGFGDPGKFYNFYFTALLNRPWLDKSNTMADMIGLPSDRILPDDPECECFIQKYAENNAQFLADFKNAFIKLASLGY
jgi:L-ascorbate peroxidase